MTQSRRERRKQQRETNKVFGQNLSTFKIDGRRLGVLAIFDTGKTLIPFRVVVPYDNIVTHPTDTEDEIKSNVGQLFYGFNYYEDIKHLQNITHAGFTEALSFSLGALAKFMYQNQPQQIFDNDDFGVIMTFDFKRLPNHDYQISSGDDSTYSEFDKWVEWSDRIKLHLSSNFEKGNKVIENQVMVF
jgi:hypothetical protein